MLFRSLGDLGPAVAEAGLAKPLVAVMLDQQESVRLLPHANSGAGSPVPAYLYPEGAARALGHAARYGAWRAASPGKLPELSQIDQAGAQELAARFLTAQRLGGWLPADVAADLLARYGIGLAAPTGAAPEVELVVAIRHEPVFGSLVLLGLGRDRAEVLDDQIARLTPLTDVDAAQMIKGTRAAPLLLGERGPAMDTSALADLLLRVSRLADDVAELAELELSPVLARPDGTYPIRARIRLAPAEPQDPFLRRLR